jgi:hypothetical protein
VAVVAEAKNRLAVVVMTDGARPGCGDGNHCAASHGGTSLRCGGRCSGGGGRGEEPIGGGGGNGVHGGGEVMSEEQNQEVAVVAYAKVGVVVLGKEQDQVARSSACQGEDGKTRAVSRARDFY